MKTHSPGPCFRLGEKGRDPAPPPPALADQYRRVRTLTETLCNPLAVEDYVIQSMADASPAKWHLAHTTWFFETFVLTPALAGYRPFDDRYSYLFNSYYNAIGERVPRQQRGLLSRPTVEEVYRYRAGIDEQVGAVLASSDLSPIIQEAVVLGLNHEQQHQELLLTDLKHLLAMNPLGASYREQALPATREPAPLTWTTYPSGIARIGHEGAGFAFDNETPRHQVFLESFQMADRRTINAEFLAFMDDGGYERRELWLSDGWNASATNRWQAPLYWERHEGRWWNRTLNGFHELRLAEPLCHVSYYEADAFARWAGARLPTEAEWEAAADGPVVGNFLEDGHFHPVECAAGRQFYGDAWEWTASAYAPYPCYRPLPGALGEYNGKFMCNQMVLRGGSCVTPQSHLRRTYRNFFPPNARWQFTGLRLARDV